MSVELVNGHVLLPHVANYAREPEWNRAFQNEIVDSEFGAESRFALRGVSRLGLSWSVTTQDIQDDARLIDRIIAAKKTGLACSPAFGRGIKLATNVTGTAVVIAPTLWPLAQNDYVLLSNGSDAYDVRQLAAVAGVNLTLSAAVSRTYYSGTFLWPLIFGRFSCDAIDALLSEIGEASLSIRQKTSHQAATVGTADAPIDGIGGWIIDDTFIVQPE